MKEKSSDKPDKGIQAALHDFAADYPEVRKVCLCKAPKPYSVHGVEVFLGKEGFRADIFPPVTYSLVYTAAVCRDVGAASCGVVRMF